MYNLLESIITSSVLGHDWIEVVSKVPGRLSPQRSATRTWERLNFVFHDVSVFSVSRLAEQTRLR